MQNVEGIKLIGNYSYSNRHCIGQGSYGKVFEGTDMNKGQVAIKQMDLRFLESDKYLKSQIKVEIEVLKRLKHNNIVRLIDVLQSTNSMYIITEFCKDGDLRDMLTKKKILSEGEAMNIFFQILDGFQHLVTNGIIHRDLKPANILIHCGIYKIADFGFARFVNDFNYSLLKSCVGSPLYMAPQLLLRKPYTTKCDIWSLGIIFYEMMYGETPWKGMDERDLLNNILKKLLNFPRKISRFSEEILRKMLVIEEKDRISWEELFSLKEKKLKRDLEVINRENKPPQPQAGPKEKLKKMPDNVAAEETDKAYNKQKKFMKSLNLMREDLCFKHYVGVKMFLNINEMAKALKCKEFLLEKFQILCAQAVKSANTMLISDLEEKERNKKETFFMNKELKNYVRFLEKEGKFYQELYEDLIKYAKNNNFYDSIKNEKEIGSLIDNEISEKNKDSLGGLIREIGFKILNMWINNYEVTEKDREVLLAFDYFVDYLSCLMRYSGNKCEIDYENLHKEKSEILDIKLYCEKICSKRNTLLKKEFQ